MGTQKARTDKRARTSAAARKPRAVPRTGAGGNGKSRFRTYREALTFLTSATDYERMARVGYNHSTFDLSRMERLLAGVGDPHKELRCVHIAGTKGKGSTATMLARMLESCGYRVGLYTSPHLMDVRERISINGTLVPEAAMTDCLAKLAPVVTKKMADDRVTFFELMTAVAFLYFSREKIDIAVVETGLGGRLDSTNVITPDVCAMTSISSDHTRQLGNSLGKIAEEKAGIFKSGVPVVSAPQDQEVRDVLRRAAMTTEAPLKFTSDLEFSSRFESSRATGPHSRVCLTTNRSRFEHLRVPLLGEHQAINCGVALGVLDALKMAGMEIDDELAAKGLADTTLPGRMETICNDPRILVDGAHNSASVDALMRAIGQNIPYDSMVVIFGCAADKDISGMLSRIAMGADKVIFTAARGVRSADPVDLYAEYEQTAGKMAQLADNAEEALSIATRAVSREDLVCVTGSFYLVAEVRKVVLQAKGRIN